MTRVGERRTAFRVLCAGVLKERDHLEDSRVEGMIRLKLIVWNNMGRRGLD